MLTPLAEGVCFMTNTSPLRVHRGLLIAVFVLFLCLSSFAQSRPVAARNSAVPVAGSLNSSLADLMRVAPATNQDLANLHQEGGKLHWVTFWRRDSAHRSQVVAALRRNLQSAVPNLIHDVQVSRGSISTTFKLYKDLSVVCESLDSLLSPAANGGKTEITALTNDLSDLNRIREELSAYIQQTSASIESKHPELVSSAGGFPKKIIIDDNIPDKPSARKRHPSSN